MQECDVGPRKFNKRFQIKQSNREERITGYLKNAWTVRTFFVDNLGIDPPIIKGDHRNESISKTLN